LAIWVVVGFTESGIVDSSPPRRCRF
jgi:hypothetical protein